MKTKLLHAGIMLLLLLGAAELAAFSFYSLNKDRFLASDLNAFVPSQELIDLERQVFDPKLGWKKRFPTSHGQRPQARFHGRNIIATYGDSFTYCDEVLGFETWQTHLSGLLQAGVLNFGNGAYGPDQAYLRFQQDQPTAGTPYAVLGLIGENIGRVVNVYRRFYLPQDGNALTKPRFHLENGTLVLEPNPTQTQASRQQLQDVEFLRQVGQNDYWFQRRTQQSTSFPYSSIFFNINLLQEVLNNFNWMQLWHEPEPRDLVLAILDAFAAESRAMGAQPIIGLFPIEFDLMHILKTGEPPAYVGIITDYCRQAGIPCFDGVTALAETVASKGDVEPLYLVMHYSPLGNERLALAWYTFLRETFPEDFGTLAPMPGALEHGAIAAQGAGAGSKDSDGFARHLLALGRGEHGGAIPEEPLAFLKKQLETDAQSAAELSRGMLMGEAILTQPDMDDSQFLVTLGRTLWGAPPSDAEQSRLRALLAGNATRYDIFFEMLWDERFRDLCAQYGVRAY